VIMAQSPTSNFVTINASVSPDGDVQLFPSFITSSPHASTYDEFEHMFAVEFVDSRGEIVGRAPLPSYELCTEPQTSSGNVVLMAKVILPEDVESFRIVRERDVLAEYHAPPETPEVRFTWSPPDRAHGLIEVTWEADNPGNVPLHFLLAFDNTRAGRWQPVSFVTPNTSARIDVDRLPGGNQCCIRLLCSDGFHTVYADSSIFALEPRPCQAFILDPEDGHRLAAGSALELSGQGYWMEEDRAEYDDLFWWSSLDGELGRGQTLTVVLSGGLHQITLRAGRDDRMSESSIDVFVEDDSGYEPTGESPEVNI
jgi:hypothetical protein